MRFSAFLLSAGLLVGLSGAANAEMLVDAVDTALNQHPTVQAALAERDYAKAAQKEKYADYFPKFNANIATGRVYGDNATSRGLTVDRGAGYSSDSEGSVSLQETIFDGFQTSNNVGAAGDRIESANSNIIDVRENLALRVVMAYLDVMRARESVGMIRAYDKKIADYRQRIEKMVQDGGADLSMAVQAHDIQNQLDGTLADVEGQFHKAMAEYEEAVGHAVSDPMKRPDLSEKTLPPTVDQAIQLAAATHPGLKAAEFQDRAAGRDIDAQKGALYPSVTGELSYYKKNVAELIGGRVVDGRALVRMNWDFSTGGAQDAKVRQAMEKQAEARAQADDLAGRIEREIRKAYAELDAARNRLAVSRDRVNVSKDLVSTYQKQFDAGKVTILNLLQAENTDFNARIGLLNADYRYQAAQYAALANMGHLQDALHIEPVKVSAAQPALPVSAATAGKNE